VRIKSNKVINRKHLPRNPGTYLILALIGGIELRRVEAPIWVWAVAAVVVGLFTLGIFIEWLHETPVDLWDEDLETMVQILPPPRKP